MIKIYTDGSAKNNGCENSYGGFGVIILKDDKIIYKHSEFYDNVTNNQMELKALIHAFDYVKNILNELEEFEIFSDSAYCVNICNDWVHKWAANGWKRSKNKSIENLDLIKELYSYTIYINTNFSKSQVVNKCSGHSDIIGNELADALATKNIKKFNEIVKKNNIKE